MVKLVLWFFINSGGELLLLLGKIAFRSRQPTSYYMKWCTVPMCPRNPVKSFASEIKLSKPERRGSEVELILGIVGQ